VSLYLEHSALIGDPLIIQESLTLSHLLRGRPRVGEEMKEGRLGKEERKVGRGAGGKFN